MNNSRLRKEDLMSKVLAQCGDHPGLVHILSAMEACSAFEPWHDKQAHKTYLSPTPGKCLHYNFYFMDAEVGLCYLRVPTWCPFRLQFYCNGHAWLAGKLTTEGVNSPWPIMPLFASTTSRRHNNLPTCFVQMICIDFSMLTPRCVVQCSLKPDANRVFNRSGIYFRSRAKTDLRTAFPASGHRRQSGNRIEFSGQKNNTSISPGNRQSTLPSLRGHLYKTSHGQSTPHSLSNCYL